MTSGTQHEPKALHLESFSVCFRSSVDKVAEEKCIIISIPWTMVYASVCIGGNILFRFCSVMILNIKRQGT